MTLPWLPYAALQVSSYTLHTSHQTCSSFFLWSLSLHPLFSFSCFHQLMNLARKEKKYYKGEKESKDLKSFLYWSNPLFVQKTLYLDLFPSLLITNVSQDDQYQRQRTPPTTKNK